MSDISVASMFCGLGGIDLAFTQAGFRVVWANDADREACLTYRHNFSATELYEGDIRNIGADRVPPADVLTAGFPCQSFSLMGHRRGFSDDRGKMFFEVARLARQMKPKVILLENVRNLVYHDKGNTFLTIFNTLASLGYMVKYDVQNACTHGNVPQQRRRIFIAAFLDYDMMEKFSFPGKIKLERSLDDVLCRSARHDESYYYREGNKYYAALNERIKDKSGLYRIDDNGVARKRYKISPTLKANMGTYPDRVPVLRDDYGIRKLTPYECLALQGFPREFRFRRIPVNAAYKQAGNTVCVPLVRRIAENIKACF